jgi:uncharacterized HAD superfamily protein
VIALSLFTSNNDSLSVLLTGEAPPLLYDTLSIYLLIVSIVGFAFSLYIVNLRHDAILYARTVNTVRKYFYDTSHLSNSEINRYIYLPANSTVPKYSQKSFFWPLFLVFLVINCGLMWSALATKLISSDHFYYEWLLFSNHLPNLPMSSKLIFCVILFFIVMHFLAYGILSKKRENSYLKFYAFGVDIDGVLNNQTEHFAIWYKNLFNKEIDLSHCQEIPVHLNENLGITSVEERTIFNTKEYWETLKFKENAKKRLLEFNRSFGYKIVLYTFRDWPQYTSSVEKEKIKVLIKKAGYTPLKEGEIKKITKEWLNVHLDQKEHTVKIIKRFLSDPFKYIRQFNLREIDVVFERGNPYVSDRRTRRNRNRFNGVGKYGLRFFVEDHPENAIKLSRICDYVFMFDEPYNRNTGRYELPRNVLRVDSWNEIYRYLKLYS